MRANRSRERRKGGKDLERKKKGQTGGCRVSNSKNGGQAPCLANRRGEGVAFRRGNIQKFPASLGEGGKSLDWGNSKVKPRSKGLSANCCRGAGGQNWKAIHRHHDKGGTGRSHLTGGP